MDGHDYGFYIDDQGARHDWSFPYPQISERFTLNFSIILRRRCANTNVSFDVTGSSWDKTGIITNGNPQPDVHLIDQAAFDAFIQGMGLAPLDGNGVYCGLVKVPVVMLLGGGPNTDNCTGAYNVPLYNQDHQVVGFSAYDWDMVRMCDQGHVAENGSSYRLDRYDIETPGFAEHRYVEYRTALHGNAFWQRSVFSNCNPDPCGDVQPTTGACCGVFAQGIHPVPCSLTTRALCLRLGGQWHEDTPCRHANCPPVGACCTPQGPCVYDTRFGCEFVRRGTYKGDGALCLQDTCPPISGACCFGGGQCLITNVAHCSAIAGVFLGVGSSCNPIPCFGPLQACCFTDGSCVETTNTDCTTRGGTWISTGFCGPSTCPQPPRGSCCLRDTFGVQTCYDNVTVEQCNALYSSLPSDGPFLPSETYQTDQTCAQSGCGQPQPQGAESLF